MNQSKKPARQWNWSSAGTRWSSRKTSQPPVGTLAPRQISTSSHSAIASSSASGSIDSHGGPVTKTEANSDDEESSKHLGLPPTASSSTTSFFEEGVQEGSSSRKPQPAPPVPLPLPPAPSLPSLPPAAPPLLLLDSSTPIMTNLRSQKSTTPSSRVPPDTPKTSSSLSPVPTSPVPTPASAPVKAIVTNIELYNARRKEIDAKSADSKKMLQRYIAEMKKTHAYIVRNTLTAARLDLNSRTTPPGVMYDEVSPFEDMKGIEVTATEAKEKKLEVGRFNVRFHGKSHASSEHKLVVPATISVTPKTLAMMPKYHSYTTLRNNILAEDDEVMRYFPYFGEDAEEEEINQLNLEETFVDRTKASAEDGKKNEYAAMYTTFITSFLEELGLSLPSVTHYLLTPHPRNESIRRDTLPEDFDPDDPKVKACRESLESVTSEELDRAEMACRVFKQTTKISMWEVVKRADQMVKECVDPPRVGMGGARDDAGRVGNGDTDGVRREEVKEMTGGNPAPYNLESYAALNCLLCFMHECPFHVNKDHDRLAMAQAGDSNYGRSTGKDNTVILRLATNVQGWACTSKGSTKDPWTTKGGKEGEDNLCSEECFMKDGNSDMVTTGTWSPAQLDLLRSSAGVLKMNDRCACLLASIINKPCTEIYRQLRIENLLNTHNPSTNGRNILTLEDHEPRQGTKRKKPAVPAIPGYPADCYLTHTHEKRTAFQACRHLGHCNDLCPCVITHVTCEKSCICSPDCPRRWRGCSCKREGRPCTKESCICVKANRECDVDLCHSCGATEALDPMNRYDDRFLRDYCQNVWLQRDMPKRTLLGRSAVAGFGLFMGENVKKDAFLGEYKGEVITSDEADRRGKLYDKRGVSFLFNLNLNQVIDATRAGNKFRYVNHSSKRPNCGAKVYMANCTHRIGMFAKRDLVAGEELFFDYGYNNKQVKFVQKEFEPPEYIPPPPTTSAARKRRPSRKKELEYLKGGKGTTERSRARATAGEAATAASTSSGPVPPSNNTPSTTSAPTSTAPATAATRVRDRSAKGTEYIQDTTTSSDEDLGQEDDGSIEEGEEESVDEEYEPETEESQAVAGGGSTEVETEEEETEDEPPRRPGGRGGVKRVRVRG